MNKKMKRQKSILPGALGVRVIKTKQHPKGDINFALRSWKKQIKVSGRLDILKTKQEFEKPSITKRRVRNSAIHKQYLQDLKSF